MTGQQLQQLIFRPGFSTKTEATEFSGRGVGLDVVRNQNPGAAGARGGAERLRPGGALRAHAAGGAGVVAGPGGALRRAPVRAAHGGGGVVARGEERGPAHRPLARAARAPRAAHRPAGSGRPARAAPARGARGGGAAPHPPVAGQAARAQRRRGARRQGAGHPPAARGGARAAPYQGAATLARGELVLILRPDWLVNVERRAESGLSGTRRALVVDDSLTARALHRTALEAGGYMVHTASNARAGAGATAPQRLRRDGLRHRHGGDGRLPAHRRRAAAGGDRLACPSCSSPRATPTPIASAGTAVGADGFLTKKDCVSGRLLVRGRRGDRAAQGGCGMKPVRVLVADDSHHPAHRPGGAARRRPAPLHRGSGRRRRRGGGEGADAAARRHHHGREHAAPRRPRARPRPSWPMSPSRVLVISSVRQAPAARALVQGDGRGRAGADRQAGGRRRRDAAAGAGSVARVGAA